MTKKTLNQKEKKTSEMSISATKSTSTISKTKDSSTVTKNLNPSKVTTKKYQRTVEKTRKNKFRAEGKNWFLTFPQCGTLKEKVVERITSKEDLKVSCVIVGQEKHVDGSPHLHIIVCLESKLSTRRADYWDFVCKKHGNYEVIRSPKKAYAYVTKEDKDPTIFGDIPKIFLDAKSSKSQDAAKMLMSGSTVKKVIEEMPGFGLANLTKLIAFKSYITNVSITTSLKKLAKPILYNGTDTSTMSIVEWFNGNLNVIRPFKAKQLWIHGPANMLKSTVLMKLSEYLRIYPLPLGEDFYDTYSDDDYDLVIADEFKSQKTISFLNEFCQGGVAMNLRIKGGQIFKKKNLPVIICSNFSIADCYSKSVHVSVNALQTRFLEVDLSEPIDIKNIQFDEELEDVMGTICDTVQDVNNPEEPIIQIDKGKEEEIIEVSDDDESDFFCSTPKVISDKDWTTYNKSFEETFDCYEEDL